ncbi:hypothetical protein GCM10009431_05540 [Gaetbulibacter jejuensis]|uniref:Uncharacterized protein n=1 Tax=Gaetbulibacter jejuensis TaxID=584607 RepID=A0ABN1JF07_9FLAO
MLTINEIINAPALILNPIKIIHDITCIILKTCNDFIHKLSFNNNKCIKNYRKTIILTKI